MSRRNDTPLSEGQRELAAGSVLWAYKLARIAINWPSCSILDRETAESAALWGLCLAARCFDPALGPWPAHSARWIRGEIRKEATRERRRGLTCYCVGTSPYRPKGPAPPPPAVLRLDAATEPAGHRGLV